jgi:hypothetical protein
MCFHRADVVHGERSVGVYPPGTGLSEYTLADLAERNFIATSTVVVRNGALKPPPPGILSTPVGDWVYHAVHARRGKIGFLDEIMSVYRLHPGGAYAVRRSDAVADLQTANAVCEYIGDLVGAPEKEIFERANQRRTVRIAEELLARGEHAEARKFAAVAWSHRYLTPEATLRVITQRARARSPLFNRAYLHGRRTLQRVGVRLGTKFDRAAGRVSRRRG